VCAGVVPGVALCDWARLILSSSCHPGKCVDVCAASPCACARCLGFPRVQAVGWLKQSFVLLQVTESALVQSAAVSSASSTRAHTAHSWHGSHLVCPVDGLTGQLFRAQACTPQPDHPSDMRMHGDWWAVCRAAVVHCSRDRCPSARLGAAPS
jgi:hypothetical protein